MVKKGLIIFLVMISMLGCSQQNKKDNQEDSLKLILEKDDYQVYEVTKVDNISKYVKERCQLEGSYDNYVYVHDLNKNNSQEVIMEGFYFTSNHLIKYDPKKDDGDIVFEVENTSRILHTCIVNENLIYYAKVQYKKINENSDMLMPYCQIIKWEQGVETIIDEYDMPNSTDGAQIRSVNGKVYYSKIELDLKNDKIISSINEVGNHNPLWYYETSTNFDENNYYLPLNHVSESNEYVAYSYTSKELSHIIYTDGNEVKDIEINGRVHFIAVVEDQIIFDGTIHGVIDCKDASIHELDHFPHLARVETGEDGVFIGLSNSSSYLTIQRLDENHLDVNIIYELGSETTYTIEHISNNEFLVYFIDHLVDEEGINYIKNKLYIIKVK